MGLCQEPAKAITNSSNFPSIFSYFLFASSFDSNSSKRHPTKRRNHLPHHRTNGSTFDPSVFVHHIIQFQCLQKREIRTSRPRSLFHPFHQHLVFSSSACFPSLFISVDAILFFPEPSCHHRYIVVIFSSSLFLSSSHSSYLSLVLFPPLRLVAHTVATPYFSRILYCLLIFTSLWCCIVTNEYQFSTHWFLAMCWGF